MAYTANVIARAQDRLRQEKQNHEAEQARRREQIFADQPRLREIEKQLRSTAARVVAVAFRRGEDPTEAIAKLREENLALQREQEWLLYDMGLDPDALDETPICERCGGSGYVGETMCECLTELCRQEQRRELSFLLDSGPDRFDQFRLDCYSDQYDGNYGASPRSNMRSVLSRCREYADRFAPGAGSLLLSGAPGLGKTFLSACIARQVAESGYSVIYDTAVNVFSEFEAAKFGDASDENRNRTSRYLDCDLLILDDLGTEMTTQFITSALYTIINTRLMSRSATIISTNLSLEALGQRYSPQIFSRLRGAYQYLFFFGDDIRAKGN